MEDGLRKSIEPIINIDDHCEHLQQEFQFSPNVIE
jgi:hypothetical protein